MHGGAVDVPEQLGGDDRRQVGDVVHHERDVCERRGVVAHASRLAQPPATVKPGQWRGAPAGKG